jgi:hypothetical protein
MSSSETVGWSAAMNPEIKEYYRAKTREAEQNAAKAPTPADRENWEKIALGYRVLTGDKLDPIP